MFLTRITIVTMLAFAACKAPDAPDARAAADRHSETPDESKPPSNVTPTSMTIDSISWRPSSYSGDYPRRVLCRLANWPGYPQAHRFASAADVRFFFEADGRTPVGATIGPGVSRSEDGAEKYLTLLPDAPLAQGVAYRLSPRNDHATLKWSVAPDVTITAP